MKKEDLQNFRIARFALGSSYEQVGNDNIVQLKRHLLDAIGSLIYSIGQPAVSKLAAQVKTIGDGGPCIAPGFDSIAIDRAAQLFTALIRYPDFMDNFLGKEATCHPSDNIGPLLAVAQVRPVTGREFLTAMAVAYQLECRLVQEIPVMKEGIDHTLLLGYSMTAYIARLLGLSVSQTAHALGIAGTSISPMVTARAAYTFEWKGFASAMNASECTGIALLAQQGMTGPIALFEGPKGFAEVFGMKLDYDWDKENFGLLRKCVLKKYNAEVHSQSSLAAISAITGQHGFDPEDIERVDITTFFTAYHIIGSGAYGNRKIVVTKEQADHSLFYLAAVLLLDGESYPEQFDPVRIRRSDVQELLQKVHVRTCLPIHKPVLVAGIFDRYTEAYPGKLMTEVKIRLKDGTVLNSKKEDYHGFHTDPLSWDDVIAKFRRLAATAGRDVVDQVIKMVRDLEHMQDVMPLIRLISGV